LVVGSAKSKRDFSRVTNGRQSHQKTSKHEEGGTVVVERFANPLGYISRCRRYYKIKEVNTPRFSSPFSYCSLPYVPNLIP